MAGLAAVGASGCDLIAPDDAEPTPPPLTSAGLWSQSLPTTQGSQALAYICRAPDSPLLRESADFSTAQRQCETARDRRDGEDFVRTIQCRVDGRRVTITQTLRGDLQSEFEHGFESSDEPSVAFRYRRLGDCPTDWMPGDVAENGQWMRPEWTVRNAVTQVERQVAPLPEAMGAAAVTQTTSSPSPA